MEAVLGLSMTSTSIGWVLLDRPGGDASILDHDSFDFVADLSTNADISRHTAAVRGAQSIASATGHQVKSVGITWSDDAASQAGLLLKALPDLGFDNIAEVRLSDAARTWSQALGASSEYEKCAVCIIESAAVTVLAVGYGTVRTSVTHMRESVDTLSRWLKEVFDDNRLQPDALYLIGSRGDLELTSGGLETALEIPVVASEEGRLALARGAALAASTGKTIDGTVSEQTSAAPGDRPSKPRRVWFGPHARAAAVLVAGVIAVFALAPAFLGQKDTSPAQTPPASNSAATSVPSARTDPAATSAGIHAVPSPGAVSQSEVVQPLAALPAPEPAEVAPIEDAPAVEQPVSQEAVPEAAPVSAQPVVAPAAPPSPQPLAVTQPVSQVPATAPQAQVPQAVVAPAPAPAAAPPLPAEQLPPAQPNVAPPPPQDPVAVVLSPLFGALP